MGCCAGMWRDNSNFDIKLHGISGWRMAMTSGWCLWLEAGVDVFVSSDAANRLPVGAVLFVINAAGRPGSASCKISFE